MDEKCKILNAWIVVEKLSEASVYKGYKQD